MPQLTLRGVRPEAVAPVCAPLVEELAALCDCSPDTFTIDCLQASSVFGGQGGEPYPFVEVAWFDRGKAVRDRFAAALVRHLRPAGVAELEVAFRVYAPEAYYVNGEPCG